MQKLSKIPTAQLKGDFFESLFGNLTNGVWANAGKLIRNFKSVLTMSLSQCCQKEPPPQSRVPNRNRILTWVNAFRDAGSVSPIRKGPHRTASAPENIGGFELQLIVYFVVQDLKSHDFEARQLASVTCSRCCFETHFFSDKAHFQLNGCVNK